MIHRARIVAAFVVALTGASTLAGDDGHVSLVPWKVLAAKDPIVDSPLTLFWIPATLEELRRSELLTSSELTLLSGRCVAMRVVRFDDDARLMRLKVGPDLPMALLVERGGRIVGRVDAVEGVLSTTKVERLVRDEINEREAKAEASLDEARRFTEQGNRAAAAAIYRSLWEQRCVCPRQGRDAKRAMKKLGN